MPTARFYAVISRSEDLHSNSKNCYSGYCQLEEREVQPPIFIWNHWRQSQAERNWLLCRYYELKVAMTPHPKRFGVSECTVSETLKISPSTFSSKTTRLEVTLDKTNAYTKGNTPPKSAKTRCVPMFSSRRRRVCITSGPEAAGACHACGGCGAAELRQPFSEGSSQCGSSPPLWSIAWPIPRWLTWSRASWNHAAADRCTRGGLQLETCAHLFNYVLVIDCSTPAWLPQGQGEWADQKIWTVLEIWWKHFGSSWWGFTLWVGILDLLSVVNQPDEKNKLSALVTANLSLFTTFHYTFWAWLGVS